MEFILLILGFVLATIFGVLYFKGRKNENTSGTNPSIDSTVADIANSTGKDRINSLLDRVRKLLQGSRSTTDSKTDSPDSSGGDPADSNGDGK